MSRLSLQNVSEMKKEPEPVVVVLCIDDGIGKREKGTICIDSNSCKKDSYMTVRKLDFIASRIGKCTQIFCLQMGTIKAEEGATVCKPGGTSPVADEQSFELVIGSL